MRKFLLSIVAFCFAFVLDASPRTHSIKIDVVLHDDGSADITEVWDIYSNTGTEWYLVRSNLGDIRIENFKVFENGQEFVYEGDWDIDRSIDEKRARCGIVDKGRKGYELCWGIGEYGGHIFTASYTMTNLVKSLEDYDAFNHQFISPEMTSAPEYASLTISKDGFEFTPENTRIWSFGHYGQINLIDGKIFAESTEQFVKKSSMIVMAAFEKGIFAPVSVQNRSFDDMKDKAFEDSSYLSPDSDNDDGAFFVGVMVAIVAFFTGFIVVVTKSEKKKRDKWLGVKNLKDIEWTRAIPFDGNLIETSFIMEKFRQPYSLAPALILRMIDKGVLVIQNTGRRKPDIVFAQNGQLENLNPVERELYDMMLAASGSDRILSKKEFSRWTKLNYKRVNEWLGLVTSEATNMLHADKFVQGSEVSESCKDMGRRTFGFKKFLQEFLLVNERQSAEVTLWKDYLVYASLYGIADKVAKELQDIDPKAFEETFAFDYVTYNHIIVSTNNFSNSLQVASKLATTVASKGGGGFSSFGGGRGFTGGGFGGGAR